MHGSNEQANRCEDIVVYFAEPQAQLLRLCYVLPLDYSNFDINGMFDHVQPIAQNLCGCANMPFCARCWHLHKGLNLMK